MRANDAIDDDIEAMNVLLVEDDDQHAKIVSRYLKRFENLQLVRKESLAGALERIAHNGIDVVLLDLELPDSIREETLQRTVDANPALPVVVLSSLEDNRAALEHVRQGAQDYIFKSLMSEDLLLRALYNARERKQVERKLKRDGRLKEEFYSLSRASIEEENIDSFFKSVLERISQLFHESIALFEYRPQKEIFSLKMTSNLQGVELEQQFSADELLTLDPFLNLKDGDGLFSSLGSSKGLHALKIPSSWASLKLKSAVGLKIDGPHHRGPFGLLVFYSLNGRIYDDNELFFLRSLSNMLTAVVRRVDLEENLKHKVFALKEADHKKNEFLSILSHELRTPISIIAGHVELLKSYAPPSQVYQESLEVIERNSKIQVKIVGDLLDMSRIIMGRFDLNMRPVVIAEVLEESLASIAKDFTEKGIKMVPTIRTRKSVILGERERLNQVFYNLLSNSLKFCSRGDVVEVLAHKRSEKIVIRFKDSGRGVLPEDLPHLFQSFWQEDTSLMRPNSGLGLGLSIVKRIVESHGGSILCESEGRHRGAEFIITLPLLQSISSPAPAESDPHLNTSSARGERLKDLKILLLDDESDIRSIYKRFMESESAQVLDFERAQDALGYYQQHSRSIDFIFSDVAMPQMNGIEFIKKLRAWEETQSSLSTPPPQVTAIALTAFGGEKDVEKILSAGFNQVLIKPTTLQQLLSSMVRDTF